LAQKVRPSFEPGALLDGLECTGDPVPSPAARHHVRNGHPHARSQLARENESTRRAFVSFRLANVAQETALTDRPAETGTPKADNTPIDVEDLHRTVLQSLDDDQAQEVVSIPLAGKSNIADHMVIASGRSTRQVASMAVKLADKIKERFGRNVRIEGLPAADWVLIDADDVIVHIFRPEVRNFYNLERMWAFGDDSSVSAAARG
jgi:ribosome-associated protein